MSASQATRVNTHDMPWTPLSAKGVAHKPLAAASLAGGCDVSLVRLDAGACLPPVAAGHGAEVVVVEGTWVLPEGALEASGYARRPAGHTGGDSTPTGCTLFVRSGPFDVAETEILHSQTGEQPWLPGQGGLRVKPLHAINSEGTAFVHWPEGERFLPHRHFGGEEIFVMSGTFQDEHGQYPAGTWLLSPHLSAHHPFVEEETVIYVKTGHLLGDAARA